MLLSVVARVFKWTRMGHLIPTLNGLAFLGRPSRVSFPVELLSQGVSVLLTGLNNTMAIQSNPDWVWPYWVERQIDPDAPEFIPTGLNLIKGNLARRNWTSLGVDGSPREGMLDPVGMLTLFPFGWSVMPYVRVDGQLHVPPRMHGRARQSLVEGDLPAVITRYQTVDRLAWETETVALRLEDHEFAQMTHRVENRGTTPLAFTYGVTLRPYNALGVGHINLLRFKKRTFKVNAMRGLLLEDRPHHFALCDRHVGDPLLHPTPATEHRLLSRSGVATGIAEWNWTLAPGESRTLRTLADLDPNLVLVNPPKPRTLFAAATQAREKMLATFRENRDVGMTLGLPDEGLQSVFQKVRNHLHVFDDVTHFAPGSYLYHSFWFRDSSFIAQAFDHLGWFGRVKPKLLTYPRRQLWNGFFRSQTGEWDSNGEAIFSLLHHARLSGDKEFLAKVYPSIRRGARWIEATRLKQKSKGLPHEGLLPAGFSAEHFGPNDHYFWDNFWGLSGLEGAAWAARALGKGGEANRFASMARAYRRDIERAMAHALERNESFTPGKSVLPSSPYRHPDTACIGTLAAISPLDLIPADAPWVRPTLDFLLEHNLRHGLFFQKIVHTGLNPYLTVQLARALLVSGDPRWLDLAKNLAASATDTGTWPEAIHPKDLGGCMGDGDHGWSAAEFINLLREALVMEVGNTLRLGAGLTAAWVRQGVWVRNAPTGFGEVTWSLTPTAEGPKLEWTVTPHGLAGEFRIEVRVPTADGSRLVELEGLSGTRLLPEPGT